VLWRRPAAKRRAEPGVLQRRTAAGGGRGAETTARMGAADVVGVPAWRGCVASLAPAWRAASNPDLGVEGSLESPAAACSMRSPVSVWRASVRRGVCDRTAKKTTGGHCGGCGRSSWGTVHSFANAVLAGIT
jgi:hypothetical protein